jgi:hypothetical protein
MMAAKGASWRSMVWHSSVRFETYAEPFRCTMTMCRPCADHLPMICSSIYRRCMMNS